ncbi:MAG: hypothetical protein JO000_15195 [Alphaproteobacteria bacterium]|nr:hypothetical protein [Alphaproteobacteria bacterium]
MLRLAAVLLLAFVMTAQAEPVVIKAACLHLRPHKAAISLRDVPANDDGLAGLHLAAQDNDTTKSIQVGTLPWGVAIAP